MEYWKRLVAHLGWADAKVQAAMESATATEPRTLELWGHILGSEHLWLARLEQRPAQVPVWPQLSLEEYGELARENQKALTEYVGRLNAADLARDVTYRNTAGLEFTSTVEDILLHLCLHGHYHRGQIALALRAAGDVPNPTDYIAFTRGAPAATRESRR